MTETVLPTESLNIVSSVLLPLQCYNSITVHYWGLQSVAGLQLLQVHEERESCKLIFRQTADVLTYQVILPEFMLLCLSASLYHVQVIAGK